MGDIKLNSIYIIILNYQSFQDTIKYVKCLQNQENVDLNILIVDNCSLNESFDILKNQFLNCNNVEVIKSERNGGYAYGNNFGLRHIEHKQIDYILISNNDIDLSDTLLLFKMMQIYKRLKNPAFVSPYLHNDGNPSKYTGWRIPTLRDDIIGSLAILEILFKNRTIYNFGNGQETKQVDCLSGSFFMAKKEVFYDIGLLDENTFLYMEEVILAFKVKRKKLANYVLLNLKYNHRTSSTISSQLSIFKMRKHLINSRVYFHKTYLQTNILGIFLLKFLFQIWKIERTIIKKTNILKFN